MSICPLVEILDFSERKNNAATFKDINLLSVL